MKEGTLPRTPIARHSVRWTYPSIPSFRVVEAGWHVGTKNRVNEVVERWFAGDYWKNFDQSGTPHIRGCGRVRVGTRVFILASTMVLWEPYPNGWFKRSSLRLR